MKTDLPEELSTDALFERSAERLKRLLENDAELLMVAPSRDAQAAIAECPTTIESIAKAFALYADRPCLGERDVDVDASGNLVLGSSIREYSFREVWSRVEAFASGLAHAGLAGPGTFIGIVGFGSIDWVVANLATIHRAAVSVPLQTGMNAADLERIVRETELACIVCSAEQLDSIVTLLPRCPSVCSVVVMDVGPDARSPEPQPGVSFFTMSEVERIGRVVDPVPISLPAERGEPDPLMSLTYTSGSTGVPKGAMYRESLLHDLWARGFAARLYARLPELPHVTVSYMPLNHGAGRMGIMASIVRGGLAVFVAKSDMSTLFDDMRLVRPTTLFLVPRVAATIYQHYQSAVVRETAGIDDAAERARIEARIVREIGSTFLGDRMLVATVGSAPTPPETIRFLERCFAIPIVDGYGSTEAGPLTVDGVVDPEVEWRLVDMPDLGYRTTDRPYPRGELHVRSRFVVPGYYKNDRATSELFDADGFLNTGDIVEQRAPNRLVWIDRAKNVLKLSQGEFVATSRLEGLFASKSPYIRQIFVYGDGFHAYLLAVVVADLEAAQAAVGSRGPVDDAAIRALILGEMTRIAREEGLRGHEVPRDVLIVREPFTEERGLLTASKKPSRPRLQARYGEELRAIQRSIERAQLEGVSDLERAAPPAEKVRRAVAVTLGIPDLDPSVLPRSFLQLGGDSLAVVGLSKLVEDLTGVHVPVGLLLNPTSSVRAIVDYVERSIRGGARHAPTFGEIHGIGAKAIRTADLRVDRFLDAAELSAARTSTTPTRSAAALLTGANGFLGRFLALELCERLEDAPKVYALVRASSDAAALDRLRSACRSDAALERRFETHVAAGRLSVLAADLIRPGFGLAADVRARLEGEVDLVVHAGALVNHALRYEELFEPNVLGTAEVLRFALARRRKTVAYVSTVGVARIPDQATEIPNDAGYALGYAMTKWASEHLLRDAQRSLGLPVLVFRPSEIMAHRSYRGQVNVPDFFTRLLAGIVYTGIAPSSFYAPGVAAQASFDGLPVDVVARSIAAIAIRPAGATGDREVVFDVTNPHHDDGISLDVIASWVRSAGYPVRRIASYEEWYRAFEDRLRSLPEQKRQHSPLAILDAWKEPQTLPSRFDTGPLLARLVAIDPALAELPHVDESFVHRMLDDMAVLHVIDAPLKLAV